MKNVTHKATIETAYGKTLPTPVNFEYDSVQYDSYDEVPAEKKLSPSDMLQAVNAAEKASARAKATTIALDAAGYTKPDPNSVEVITENMIKGMMKLHGLTREQAEAAFKLASEAATAVK